MRALWLTVPLSLLVGLAGQAGAAGVSPESPASQPVAASTAAELRANRIARRIAAGFIHNKSHWGQQPRGWFVSGRIDLGTFFLKPRLSAGYGRAHWRWVGLDVNPLFSTEGIGLYGGLRIALPFIDLRVGGRYRYTFRRHFLGAKERYEREDIEMREGPKSRYLSWEAELTGGFPLGPGSVNTELAGTYVSGVDEGMALYEETLRVVLEPPWVWRGLVGYSLRFLRQNALRIGVAVQFVHNPGRDKWVVRAGGIARFRLAYNVELRGTFMPAVHSNDSLGLAAGDSYQLGVRYLWAWAHK